MYQFSMKSDVFSSQINKGENKKANVIENMEQDSVIQFVRNGIGCSEILCEIHYLRRNDPYKLNECVNSTILCCLSVPTSLSLDDFLDFINPYFIYIKYIRFLRTSNPVVYGVLLDCKSIDNANLVYQSLNGQFYPITNSYCCHIVFVNTISYHNGELNITQSDITKEPVYIISSNDANSLFETSSIKTTTSTLTHEHYESNSNKPIQSTINTIQSMSNANSNEFNKDYNNEIVSSTEIPILLRDLYSDIHELPNCAICLEKLDIDISCLVITFCQHIFHCNCIYKWSNPHCPVCRALQGDEILSKCTVCHCEDNLWMCLICGYVGCSRYKEGHAYQHYLMSHHVYSLNIETQATWDYSQDKYVHRLIRNDKDGSIIAIPSIEEEMNQTILSDKKEQFISHSYEQLYSIQLETQKSFYEEQINTLQLERNSLLGQLNSLHAEHKDYVNQIKTLQEKNKSYVTQIEDYKKKIEDLQKNQTNTIPSLNNKTQENTETQLNSNQTLSIISTPEEYQEIIEDLQKRIETTDIVYNFKLQQKDRIIAELKEENSDLYKHFSLQKSLPEECQSSSVILPTNSSSIDSKTLNTLQKKKKKR